MSSIFRGQGGGKRSAQSIFEDARADFALHFDSPREQRELGKRAGDITVEARNRLQGALAVLNTPDNWHKQHVRDYAKRYFLIDRLTEGDANQKIKPILELAWNGLGSSSLNILIKKQVDGSDAEGVVPRNMHSKGKVGGVFNLEEKCTYEYGTIGIASRLVSDDVRRKHAVETIIHEATHKFAGTWDYCYFDADGEFPMKPAKRGNANAVDPDGFTNQTSALENADSFAWFAYKLGRGFA